MNRPMQDLTAERRGTEIVLVPAPALCDHPRRQANGSLAFDLHQLRQIDDPTPEQAAWLAILEGKCARAAEELVSMQDSRGGTARLDRLDRAVRKRQDRRSQ